MKVNRIYKDRLFRLVFSDRRNLLELYNALNGSHYEDPEALEITTLEDAIYMSVKNDLSFLIDNVLNLYEHQSTYNPNMPVRGFLYLADAYRKYVEQRKLNLYSSSLLPLPTPNYLVFYNGLKDAPDRMELRLSDAFAGKGTSCLELKATMLNINLGHNRELMERCKQLHQYARFVDRVRCGVALTGDLEQAVNLAVDQCIREGILAEVLSEHRAEVLSVILTDYNEEEHIAMEREEAKNEARAESILDFLSDLGSPSPSLKYRIHSERSAKVLTRWLKLAARADSIEDFKKKAGF